MELLLALLCLVVTFNLLLAARTAKRVDYVEYRVSSLEIEPVVRK